MTDSSELKNKKAYALFKSDKDWWNNACLNYTPNGYDLYATGYKRAGNLLAEHINQTGTNQDVLVYPIIFLYRQYIELRLKELIREGSILLALPPEVPQDHRIEMLWKHCKKILKKVFQKDGLKRFDRIEEIIYQFSERDPFSIAFRYPTDKKGKASLPGLTHINIRRFKDAMDKLASFLESASVSVSCYLELKREMESSY